MIRNYFKIAWRNILNNKFYASINIIGLTVGLTVGLLILLWVNDELSFDKFNTKADNIYRIEAQMGGATKQIWGGVQSPVTAFGLKEVPGVVSAVRLIQNWSYSIYKYKDRAVDPGDNGSFYTDSSFFKVFDFKLLKGDVNKPFPTDQSVLVTEATAKRFFGDANPMGKIIQADNHDNYTVAGIVADVPDNSSIKFDMLFSVNAYAKQNYDGKGYWKTMDSDWGDYYCNTYFLLKPGTSAKAVTAMLTQIHIKNQPGADAATISYIPEPLTQMHLYNADGTPSGIQTVRVFLIVAILILLIACINYVNLSTARSMLRAKEVSVRKIIGAAKKQLFAQFLVETILFFSIALVMSFILIELLMPLYNDVSGKQMEFNLFNSGVWQVIGITIVATLAASSIYPALLLSSFKPINALKGKISLGVGNVAFRKTLVVCQFVFSIGLIIGTLIINSQLKFIREKELGYDKSYVFSFGMRDMQKNYDALRAQLLTEPGIKDITTASDNIVAINNSTGDTDWDGKPTGSSFIIHPLGIAKNYMAFFKLKMAYGNSFTGISSDSSHYILNETAVREAGITNPVGKRFKLHSQNGIIIGVVKDFHFASLKQKIEPSIFFYTPQNWRMFVKTTGKDAPLAINAIQKVWKQYNPAFPFDYEFLDTTYNDMYKTDERSGTLFSWFAGIAILISCLGLFGLATYTAQVKVKEIGIRKVLGASVTNITTMLSKDFLVLVVLSLIIATPIAWYAMNSWLEAFVYRITISGWTFALAGTMAIIIAFLTISFQAIKAALANPVKSLRSE